MIQFLPQGVSVSITKATEELLINMDTYLVINYYFIPY